MGAVGATGIAGCSGSEPVSEEVKNTFRIADGGFQVATNGGSYNAFDIKGINLGMAKPGHFPGEAAITRAEYDRWLEMIGELNVNIVRVYTVHPPAFYRALAAYNREHTDPIYLMHGNWIGEEQLIAAGDAFSVSEPFDESFRRVVDVIHGATTVPAEPGQASGTYDADVSQYVAGYIIGIEWPPTVVLETNDRHEPGQYEGTYLSSTVERPFERWLAKRLDGGVSYEMETYNVQRPAAFTNWVTTDPLSHPYEPFEMEDAVPVDPDGIVGTEAYDAGTFGAYHVYPYYPPLLNETPEYVDYIDHRGEKNSYAGYLNDLVGASDHPLIVAEFGVPTSRGLSQRHVHGRDQGRHSEVEQGEIVAAMYEDIHAADTAGGIVFSWHDEWFKRTWNFAPLSDPNRRPLWSNVQTPEQRFGFLAFDPAGAVPLDGSADAWVDADELTPVDRPTYLGDGSDDARALQALRVTSDEAYLSVRIELADLGEGVNWKQTNYLVTLGLSGRGSTVLPYGVDASAPPTDFVVRLGGPDASRVTVDTRYDVFAYLYGEEAGLDRSRYRNREEGRFTPIRTVKNRGYTVPVTEEAVPFAAVETGQLRYGNGNPAASDYDSLADVHVSPHSDAIELRLPWLLLNVADPSSRQRLGDFWSDGRLSYEPFSAITVGAASYHPADTDGTATELASETNLTHAVRGLEGGRLLTGEYVPETWDEPAYTERLKEGADHLKATFDRY